MNTEIWPDGNGRYLLIVNGDQVGSYETRQDARKVAADYRIAHEIATRRGEPLEKHLPQPKAITQGDAE